MHSGRRFCGWVVAVSARLSNPQSQTKSWFLTTAPSRTQGLNGRCGWRWDSRKGAWIARSYLGCER